MKPICPFLIGVAIAVMAPAAVEAQKVRYDVAPNADFTTVKTYAFKEPRAAEMETMTDRLTLYDSPLMKERTRAAIAAQLQSRGMTQDDKQPDVYVEARRIFRMEYATYSSYPAWGWGGYPYGWRSFGGYHVGGPMYTEEVVIGTLVIDLQDAATGHLLWRGTGEKTLHETSKPEKRIERVNREVAKIFRDFPPDGLEDDEEDDDDRED